MILIPFFVSLSNSLRYSFQSNIYRCNDHNCTNKTQTTFLAQSTNYFIQLYLTSDYQNEDKNTTKFLSESGLIPYIMPDVHSVLLYLNSEEKKQFRKLLNSWGFQFSVNQSGKYCFRIFPNMITIFPIVHSKLCYLVHSNHNFTDNFNRILNSDSIKFPSSQSLNPEFSIVHFFNNKTSLFYSPDYYHSIYSVNYTIPDPQFNSIIINNNTNILFYNHQSKLFSFHNSKFSSSHRLISYSSSTNKKFFTFLKLDKSFTQLFVYNFSSQTAKLYSKIDPSDFIHVCGGLLLYSNYSKLEYVYITILQHNSSKNYTIHKYYTGTNHTEQMTYPKIIPNVTTQYPYPKGWNVKLSYITSDIEKVQPTIITGATSFNSYYPQWSVIYGNFLAISNTFGRTYFTIMTLSNDVIENFYISNTTSRFIFRTKHQNKIYYGDLYSNIVEQVPFENSSFDINKTVILFNSNEEPEFVDISNPQSPIHYPVPPETIRQNSTWCPYLKITYEFFDLDYFTRVKQPISSTHFPAKIFIDHSDTFHFRIHATYHRTVPNLLFSSPFHFNMTYSKTIDYSYSMATYDFWIKDSLTYNDFIKNGYETKSERFDIFFENSSSACKNFHTYFDVTSGCLPGLKLEYEFQNKQSFFNHQNMEFLQFSTSWSPHFYLYDITRDMKIPYNSLVAIDVIGYGPDSSSFIETHGLSINIGDKKRIFGYLTNMHATAATNDNNTIQWLCQIGSVCNKVAPKFPEPPCYYLKLRARTVPRNLTNSSFCTLETEFYVKLSGIPMDVFTMVKFSFSTLFVFSVLFIIMYFHADKLNLMRHKNPLIHLHAD